MAGCCGGSSANGLVVGSRPTVTATFRDEDGVLSNPSSVRVITRDPSGDEITYNTPDGNITNPSVGIWEFTFPAPLTEVGTWWVYFRGLTGLQAAAQIKMRIKGANVTV
jgi:hypothetical protein